MIRSVSKTIYAYPGETATIVADLKPRIDTVGNFSLETASPGGWWGTAVIQWPAETPVPPTMKTESFNGICHEGQPQKQIKFKCEYGTWIRVVQYLKRDEIPSISATISVDTTLYKRCIRLWRRWKIEQPKERTF